MAQIPATQLSPVKELAKRVHVFGISLLINPPPCLQARLGVFHPPVYFSDVLMSSSLSLKGTHNPLTVFLAQPTLLLSLLFCVCFSNLLFDSD